MFHKYQILFFFSSSVHECIEIMFHFFLPQIEATSFQSLGHSLVMEQFSHLDMVIELASRGDVSSAERLA